MNRFKFQGLLIGLAIAAVVAISAVGGAIADRLFVIKPLDALTPRRGSMVGTIDQRLLNEESVVINVAESVSPSVVTVAIQRREQRGFVFDVFEGFRQREESGQPRDIGTGFVVSEDGLIVTNKHVVSESGATYKVVTKDGTEYDVETISRDPSNDIAVLKINANGLTPLELGNSDDLRVGQFVVAIGTALGEFRHTVTTGVISGLGRGIAAGSAFEGFVERLDDVIQTDAAINPGNSGGPLLNSVGQVIGINVAVAAGAENIGFAIPVNVVKDALNQFQTTGSFAAKPFLGVQYQMISQQAAVLNDVPQGAYITDVVGGSPAEGAGIEVDDIITKFDGKDVRDENGGLAELISQKKPGDSVSFEVWRNGETLSLQATLSEFTE